MSRVPRHRRRLLALVLVAVAAVVVPAAAVATPTVRHRPPAHLAWQACTDPDFAGMQCGTMRVPVDWSRPHGQRLSLAMVRRPADDPSRRLGTLLMNNGLGRSSIEQLRYAMRTLPQVGGALTERFDVVAVDPRGVGHSTPVRCAEPLKPAGISYFPQNRAAFAKLVRHNRTLGRDCVRRNGSLVAHLDMTSTARDFEAVRRALGVRRLNWYGIQYSDLLGRTYAKLYPGRLRTMVLDTAVDDTVSPVAWALREAGAAEDSFNRFAAWCTGSTDCALSGKDVAAEYDALVARANRDPIPAGDHRPMTGEDIQQATQNRLTVSEYGWPALAAAIAKAQSGDASLFVPAGDKTLDPVQERAQACATNPRQIHSFGQLRRVQRRLTARAPHLGGAVAAAVNLAGCIGWPTRPRPVHAGAPVWGAPPALVVQSTHQAYAPHSAAYAMARQLSGSVVLSHEGDDFSMFVVSQCVRDATNRYLVDRTLPARGTTCTD